MLSTTFKPDDSHAFGYMEPVEILLCLSLQTTFVISVVKGSVLLKMHETLENILKLMYHRLPKWGTVLKVVYIFNGVVAYNFVVKNN